MLVKIRQKTGCKSSGSGSYHRINAQQTIVFLSITIIITQWSSFLEKYFPQLGFMEHYFQQMWTVLQKKKQNVRNISHIFICFESVYSTIFLELLFKILLFIYSFYLILTVLGLRCCTGFSLVVVRGTTLELWCVASHCCGFSCCRAQSLGFSSRGTWVQ